MTVRREIVRNVEWIWRYMSIESFVLRNTPKDEDDHSKNCCNGRSSIVLADSIFIAYGIILLYCILGSSSSLGSIILLALFRLNLVNL